MRHNAVFKIRNEVTLKTGDYNHDVDVLLGWNKEDGLILTTPLYTTPSLYILYRNLWSVIAPGILFHLPVTDSNFDASKKANQLADFYLGGTSHIKPENFDKITGAFFVLQVWFCTHTHTSGGDFLLFSTDMFTDAFVTYAVYCFSKHAQNTQKVYQYQYIHEGKT